jgi:hypothetical protein
VKPSDVPDHAAGGEFGIDATKELPGEGESGCVVGVGTSLFEVGPAVAAG